MNTQESNNDNDFKKWMRQVDGHVASMSGLSVYDLPDMAFRDSFNAGESPHDMALMTLDDAGYPMELFD